MTLHQPGSLTRIHAAAAILAVLLARSDIVHPGRVHIQGGGIQTVGISAIFHLVHGFIIVDAQSGTHSLQQAIHLHRSFVDTIIFVILVVGHAANNHAAAVFHIFCHHFQELRLKDRHGIAIFSLLCGSRHHQQIAVCQQFRSDFLGFHMYQGVHTCSHAGHVIDLSGIITGNIVVGMGAVHHDTVDHISGHDHQLQRGGVTALLRAQHTHHRSGDLMQAAGLEGIVKFAEGRAGVGHGGDVLFGVDHFTGGLIGENDRADKQGLSLVVIQLHGEMLLILGKGHGLFRLQSGNAHSFHLTHPHRSSYGNVSVSLGDAQIVVVVFRRHSKVHGAFRSLQSFLRNAQAAVDDDFHLANNAVGGVGQIHGNAQFLTHILCGDDRAHQLSVQGVVDMQVVILGGINTVVAQGIIDTLSGQIVRQGHSTGGVGIAPHTSVVILVVGGSYMPALIQSTGIIFIRGEIAAGADGAGAVAHFHQSDQIIIDLAVVAKVGEIAESGAGVVELAEGFRHGCQGSIVILDGGGVLGIITLSTALPAGGIEGIHMAQAVGPGHFITVNANKSAVGHAVSSLMALLPLHAGSAVDADHAGVGIVKGIGVVSNSQEVQILCLVGIAEGFLHMARTVGNGGVGMELTEVDIIALGSPLGVSMGDHSTVVKAGLLGIGTDAESAKALFQIQRLGVFLISTKHQAVLGGGIVDGCALSAGVQADGQAVPGDVNTGTAYGQGHALHSTCTVILSGHSGRSHTLTGSLDFQTHGQITDDRLVAFIVSLPLAAIDAVGDFCTLGGAAHGQGHTLLLGKLAAGIHGDKAHSAFLHNGACSDGNVGQLQVAAGLGRTVGFQTQVYLFLIFCQSRQFEGVAVKFLTRSQGTIAQVKEGFAVSRPADPIGLVRSCLGLCLEGHRHIAPTQGGEGHFHQVSFRCAHIATQVALGIGSGALSVGNNGEGSSFVGIFQTGEQFAGNLRQRSQFLREAAFPQGNAAADILDSFMALHHRGKLQSKHAGSIVGDPVITTPVALLLVVLHIAAPDRVLQIDQAITCGLGTPLVVDLVQCQAGKLRTHGQFLAIMGDGQGTIGVILHRPDIVIIIAGESIARHGHRGGHIIVATVGGRQSHIIGRGPNHIIAIRDQFIGSLCLGCGHKSHHQHSNQQNRQQPSKHSVTHLHLLLNLTCTQAKFSQIHYNINRQI